MPISRIQSMGSIAIAGLKVTPFIQLHRVFDELGTIQIVVDGLENVTGGSFNLLGQPYTGIGDAILYTIDFTDLTSDNTIVARVPLMNRMRTAVIGGVSAPEAAVACWIME